MATIPQGKFFKVFSIFTATAPRLILYITVKSVCRHPLLESLLPNGLVTSGRKVSLIFLKNFDDFFLQMIVFFCIFLVPSWCTSLLYIVGELTGGKYLAVAVAVGDVERFNVSRMFVFLVLVRICFLGLNQLLMSQGLMYFLFCIFGTPPNLIETFSCKYSFYGTCFNNVALFS